MTVSTTVSRWQYNTNGTTGPWTVGAYFIADEDLSVTYTNADGVDTALILGVDYTVTGAGSPAGGTITTTTAYPSGGRITIVDDPEALQGTDYSETDAFPAATHERALDKLTLIAQRLRLMMRRAIRVSDSESELAEAPSAQDRALKTLTFDANGAPVYTTPASGTASALATSLLDPDNGGASMVAFRQAGTGATSRTIEDKLLDESRTPRDFGASGLAADNATSATQAAMDAAIADSTSGNSLAIDDGDYRVSTITIDVDDVATSSAGRIAIYGNGSSSQVTMRDSPNQDIFSFSGTGSFGACIHDLRFGVGSQGNTVDASVVNTGTSATMLDFQLYDLYINGCPRGISGQYVSGIITNVLFDFMTDFGIHGVSKEFRKLEITGNHYYKVKQRAVYVQGDIDSSGNPTDVQDRDDGRGAGHWTLSCSGFDRVFDTSETCQQVYINSADNWVQGLNWHNGKTPPTRIDTSAAQGAPGTTLTFASTTGVQDGMNVSHASIAPGTVVLSHTATTVTLSVSTTAAIGSGQEITFDEYPTDAVRYDGCTDFVISGEVMRHFKRGAYFANCSRFTVRGLSCTKGNMDASASVGAITFLDCTDFTADVTVHQSGGLGVAVDGCTDFALSGLIDEATYTGLLLLDCARGKVDVKVVDANMADSATTANTIGIDLQGTSSGIDLSNSHSYVTNTSAGQMTNLRMGASTTGNKMHGGRLTSVRTGGAAVADTGTGNKVHAVSGWVTKAAGQATITNPGTTVVVNHGMDVTPSIADINLTFNDASAGVTRMWPSTITSTQFTINVNATPTTSSAIGWYIDSER